MVDEGVPLLISLINYAETLVKPAEDESTLRTAVDALAALGVRLVAPTAETSVAAARHRALKVSLADGFALATAQAYEAHIASFDRRVQRVLRRLGIELAPQLS